MLRSAPLCHRSVATSRRNIARLSHAQLTRGRGSEELRKCTAHVRRQRQWTVKTAGSKVGRRECSGLAAALIKCLRHQAIKRVSPGHSLVMRSPEGGQ